MNANLYVDNIKCGGCANSIIIKLNKLVNDTKVDVEEGKVSFEYADEETLEQVKSELNSMGYSSKGTSNFTQKASSYVSCMIGRLKPNQS